MKGRGRGRGRKAEKGIEKADNVNERWREGKMMEGGERGREGGGGKADRRENE